MSANFYSLRNMLERGEIQDSDIDNQYLAAVISSYPCLDIWVRVADDRNLDVRVMYMQKDPNYVATKPWQRDGENPKVWKQYQGDMQSVRDWFIGVLQDLSRLNDEKRHGLHNFGAANPYDGGGMIVNVNNDGSFTVLGRFGLLEVTVEGVTMPFTAIDWSFDGCEVTAVIPPPSDWGGGNGPITIVDRPVQNMTGSTFVYNPSVTLTYQYGTGGYRREAGSAGFNSFFLLGTVGYTDGTQHGPPDVLSPTSLPDYNFTSPVLDWTGTPSSLMDSFYGTINGTVTLPLVSDNGTTKIFQDTGTANVIRWTKTQSTWFGNGTGFSGADNFQGLAVATAEAVPGTWTVTKTVNGNNFDWTWDFNPDNPGPTLGFQQTSLTTSGAVYMHTNGTDTNVNTFDGPDHLEDAKNGQLTPVIQSATVPLDAEGGPGFVINGDRTVQSLIGDKNVGIILEADASFGALTIV